jgi:AraC-like DNA-binding protein
MSGSSPKAGSVASIIQDVTNLDVLLLGRNGQILEELGRHSVPNALFFTAEEIERLFVLLSYGEALRCAEATTGSGLSYVAFRHKPSQRREGLLLVGPFLYMPVSGDWANRAILKYGLPVGDRPSIENLYSSIPHVGKTYAANLGLSLRAFLQGDQSPLELIEFLAGSEPATNPPSTELSLQDQNRVKDFYALEKRMREAVETGDYRLFLEVTKEGNYFNYFKFRVTQDTLRAAKNLNIGYNALLRLAALDGGANPILTHTLTWRYVRVAQAARSVEELMKIQNAMAEDFIALVRNRKLEGHSSTMREALEYIDMHLNSGLTLKEVSAYLKLSPSNLAYYFRKELGCTFLEYVGNKRVDEACLLLNDSSLSIKEIAGMVGFCNVSHFIKVFRGKHGTTPKQYRRSISLPRA